MFHIAIAIYHTWMAVYIIRLNHNKGSKSVPLLMKKSTFLYPFCFVTTSLYSISFYLSKNFRYTIVIVHFCMPVNQFLYACESWTLTAELEKRTQAFEMRCYRRLLNISYKDHVTKMVWPCLKVFWFSKDNPTGHSERKKKKRQTEEEVGRQYQRVDRNGLCQLN